MDRYLEHPCKVSRWRGDAFEVLPDADAADVTVWFAVEPAVDGGTVWEGLLGRRTAPDRAVVAGIPVFSYDLSLGDEVELLEAEGSLVATGLVGQSGNYTYRVWLAGRSVGEAVEAAAAPSIPEQRDALRVDERWLDLQRAMEPFGCWFDVFNPHLVAVSADAGQAPAVAGFLSEGERARRFGYEKGRTSVGS
jgi:hypothetical protein